MGKMSQSDMKNNTVLDLRIPELKPAQEDGFSTNPKNVKKWIKELPLANLGAMTQQVYRALKELNATEIKTANRFEILEDFREPVQFIINGLRKHYAHKALPLTEKNRDIANLAIELFQNMSVGYKIIVEQSSSAFIKINNKQLSTSIQRSIRYLSSVLIENYLIYAACKEGTWEQIHVLYQYASNNKLNELNIPDDYLTQSKSTTIANTYMHILLVSATDPFHMRLGEVTEVYDEMESWTHYCKIQKDIPTQLETGTFLVRPSMDLPPINFNSDQAKKDKNNFVFITHDLIDAIDSGIQKSQKTGFFKKKPKILPNEKILSRVLLSLGILPKRKFNRTETTGKVAAVTGLTAIHHLLHMENGDDVNEIYQDSKSHFSAKEQNGGTNYGKNVWNLVATGHGPDVHKMQMQKQTPQQQAAAATPTNVIHDEWRLCNISSGGYCVISDNSSSSKVQIGELIAIKEVDIEDGVWQLGVVRWLKTNDDIGVALGVQILFPGGSPVITKVKNDDGALCPAQKSILLPAIKPLNQPSTIITPILHYTVGKEVTVRTGKKAAKVVLTKMVQSTNAFSQFEYVATNKEENLPLGNVKTDDEFNSIWTSI